MTGKLLVVYLIALTVDAQVFDVPRMALTILGSEASFSNTHTHTHTHNNPTSINIKTIEC
jgi:hypothetical protein